MSRFWQAAADEPMISFALVGGLLFVINGFRGQQDTPETIEVRPSTIRALAQMQEDLLGRSLSEQEQQNVVDDFIDEEVLIREAFRLELEKKDSRVRKRLLDVMRSTLDQPVAAPTRAELEAYFRESGERFAVDEVITFDHVFFAYGSENEPDDLDPFLESLRAGAEHKNLGDDTMFGRVVRQRSLDQLRRSFGTQFATEAFSLPLDQWQGPIESGAGIHFLRVTEKRVPPRPSFDQMEDYLRQDWMFRRRRAIQDEKIAEMRKRYRIVFADEQ